LFSKHVVFIDSQSLVAQQDKLIYVLDDAETMSDLFTWKL